MTFYFHKNIRTILRVKNIRKLIIDRQQWWTCGLNIPGDGDMNLSNFVILKTGWYDFSGYFLLCQKWLKVKEKTAF